MTFTTAFFLGLVVVCMILSCFEYSPITHHSHYQKRRRGKFAKSLDEVERVSIRFVQIDERKLVREE